ncbi:MAG: hypothetical protein ABR915_21320 [Thermoguttaceae bacterium]
MRVLSASIIALVLGLGTITIAEEKETGATAYNDLKEPYHTKLLNAWREKVSDIKKEIQRGEKSSGHITADMGTVPPSRPGMSRSDLLKQRKAYTQSLNDSKKAYTQRLNDLKKELKQLEINNPPYIPYIGELRNWSVGDYGRAAVRKATIVQIVGKTQMLVRLLQIRDDHAATIMLSGFSTEGLTDDSDVDISQPIQITGTTTYNTVIGGTKTVLVAKPLDLESLKR